HLIVGQRTSPFFLDLRHAYEPEGGLSVVVVDPPVCQVLGETSQRDPRASRTLRRDPKPEVTKERVDRSTLEVAHRRNSSSRFSAPSREIDVSTSVVLNGCCREVVSLNQEALDHIEEGGAFVTH